MRVKGGLRLARRAAREDDQRAVGIGHRGGRQERGVPGRQRNRRARGEGAPRGLPRGLLRGRVFAERVQGYRLAFLPVLAALGPRRRGRLGGFGGSGGVFSFARLVTAGRSARAFDRARVDRGEVERRVARGGVAPGAHGVDDDDLAGVRLERARELDEPRDGEHAVRVRLQQRVLELGGGVGGRERHRDRAHAPHREHRGDVLRPGGRHHGDRPRHARAAEGEPGLGRADGLPRRRERGRARGRVVPRHAPGARREHHRARGDEDVAVRERARGVVARDRGQTGGTVRHRATHRLHGPLSKG